MRYATFSLSHDPSPRVGLLAGERAVDLRALIGAQWQGQGPLPSSLLELIDGGPAMWQRIASLAESTLQPEAGAREVVRSIRVRLARANPAAPEERVCLGRTTSHMQGPRVRAAGRTGPEVAGDPKAHHAVAGRTTRSFGSRK